MQATVHRYEPESRSGDVLLDDGVVRAFDAEALSGSGLLHLRAGQRVSIEEAADGRVTRVWIRGIGEGETIG